MLVEADLVLVGLHVAGEALHLSLDDGAEPRQREQEEARHGSGDEGEDDERALPRRRRRRSARSATFGRLGGVQASGDERRAQADEDEHGEEARSDGVDEPGAALTRGGDRDDRGRDAAVGLHVVALREEGHEHRDDQEPDGKATRYRRQLGGRRRDDEDERRRRRGHEAHQR